VRRVAYVIVGLAAALVAILPAMPAAAAPALRITGLQTQPGLVRFTLTARGLTNLDPSSITVTAGAQALQADFRPTTDAKDVPPRALMLVVDASARVSAEAWTATKTAAASLVTAVPPDVAVGLVMLSTQPIVVPPTTDRPAVEQALNGLNPIGSGTLLSGLLAADDALHAAGLSPVDDQRVVVISDGRDLTTAMPENVRASLVAAGAPVDIVAVGSSASSLVRLKTVTDATGGRLSAAADQAAAMDALANIARTFSAVLQVSAIVPDGLNGKASTLTVSIAGVSTSTPVTFSPGVEPEVVEASRLGWLPNWLALVFGGMVFVALILAVLVLVWPRSQAYQRMKQIELFGPARTTPTPKANGEPATSAFTRKALEATATMVRSGGMEAGIALRLERAGMRMRPQEWVLLQVCVGVLAAILVGVLTNWIGFFVGLLLGYLATVAYRQVRVGRRTSLFAEQLPDALQLVIGSLRSGFSLQQSLESLVRESPDPVAAEFGRAVAEHRLGADISDALEGIAQRTDSEDLAWAVMAVRIQREVGGNLAEVLQTTVDTMRDRARLRRHVRSLSAEGRLSAWILIALPLLLGLFMSLYRRQYMRPLFTDSLGITLLACGGVLFGIGIFWMTRVIKVEA
jgi:Flp pilus assembly protein TadB/Mg-chelatase subunit ChlD